MVHGIGRYVNISSNNQQQNKMRKKSRVSWGTLVRLLIIIFSSRTEKGKQVFHAEPHVLDLVTAQSCRCQRTLLFLQLETRSQD